LATVSNSSLPASFVMKMHAKLEIAYSGGQISSA
jgi:hypothetical protein